MTPIIDEELSAARAWPVPPKTPAAPPVAQTAPRAPAPRLRRTSRAATRPRRQLAVIEAGGAVEQRQPRRQGRGEAPLVDAASGARDRVGPARPPGRHPARDRLDDQHATRPRGARRAAARAARSRAVVRSSLTVSAATTAPRLPGSVVPARSPRRARPRTPSRPSVKRASSTAQPLRSIALDRGASARLQRPGGAGDARAAARGPRSSPATGRAAPSARTISRTSRKCSGP